MSLLTHPAMPPRLASVPAFPTVAMKLMNLLGDNNSQIINIAACIASDPMLAGRVLRRANAADFVGGEVRDVLHAIVRLGLDRTREVTLATATLAYLGSSMETELLRPCWHHTVACSLAAAEIAQLMGRAPGELHTAGLLHDIGRLGLLTAYPAEYEELLIDLDDHADGLRSLERARFGVDHTEAGHWLARRWNLPEAVAEATLRHHDVPQAPVDQLAIVQIGCRLADLVGYSATKTARPPEFDEICALLPPLMQERLWGRLPALQQAIADQLRFFEHSDPPEVTAPLEVNVDEEEEQELLVQLPLAFPRYAAPKRGGSLKRTMLLALVAAAVIAAFLFTGDWPR